MAPQFLEGKLKALCPYLSQAVVHGDNRKYCSALFTVDEEAIRKWGAESGVSGSYADFAAHPKTKALIQGYVDQLNKDLPSYETIKYFALLPADLSEKEGELTASMKVKRKIVERKYKHLLDGFYRESSAA